MENNANPFLNPDWLRLQQQFIDSLSTLKPDLRKTTNPYAPHPAWYESPQSGTSTVDLMLPGVGKVLFEHILQQTRQFYSMTEHFAGMLHDVAATDSHSEDWRTIVASHFVKMQALITQANAKKGTDTSSLFHPLAQEGWEKTLGGMPVLPVELFNSFHGDIEKLQQRLLSVPGMGPTRELQEKIVRVIQLWNVYQEKAQQYGSSLVKLGGQALDRLQQKIVGLADTDKKISSLKQIYNLWIDSNEEVFAQVAFKPAHARLYANMVNSLMQYRKQSNEIIDYILGSMNLPTAEGMNTVYKNQRQIMQTLRSSMQRQKQMEQSFHQLQASLDRFSMDNDKPEGDLPPGPAATRKKSKKKKPAGTQR